jgi:hypothetical protein
MAVGCFVGAEIVEKIATRWILGRPPVEVAREPRRVTFAVLGLASAAALGLMFLPVRSGELQAEQPATAVESMDVETLARRVLDEPWKLRMIDLRPASAYLEQRIPGSENGAPESLRELGLQYSRGLRDLVLVGEGELPREAIPEAAFDYPGRVLVLAGGFAAWKRFALTAPRPPAATAGDAELRAYRFQSAVHAAMTGAKPPPPPPKTTKFLAPPKRKAGGCS